MLNSLEPAERLEFNSLAPAELLEVKVVRFSLLLFVFDEGGLLFWIHVIWDGSFHLVNVRHFALWLKIEIILFSRDTCGLTVTVEILLRQRAETQCAQSNRKEHKQKWRLKLFCGSASVLVPHVCFQICRWVAALQVKQHWKSSKCSTTHFTRIVDVALIC